MEAKNMLASLKVDTSRIEAKINSLLEVFPEGRLEHLLDLFPCLLDKIVFVDSSVAVVTRGSFDIVYTLDFDAAAYSQIMTTAGTLKAYLTHK
jgi:hypothetical protein